MALFQRILMWHSRDPVSAPSNMASDEALLRWMDARSKAVPVLRIYYWQRPSVSFGYFQTVQEAVDFAKGRSIVRRWTGGGLVEHGGDNQLTYTLVVPREHPFAKDSTLRSYIRIHQHVAMAFAALGIPSRLHEGDAWPPGGACFVRPAPGDILDPAGRKLAGAGQRRSRAGLLHQGSLQLNKAIPHALPDRLAAQLGDEREPIDPTHDAAFRAEVAQIEQNRYANEAWLRKR